MQRLIRRMRSEESGQLLVLVGLSMTFLFGLVALSADVGRLYLERQRLTSVADVASLAAVQALPDREAAETVARDYLDKNGVDPDAAAITVNEAGTEVSVTLRNEIDMTFAVLLGFDRSGTWGSATARRAAVSGTTGAVPLGVPRDDWVLGETVVLKRSASGGYASPGNFQALALGGHGANQYEENLQNGYTGWIRIGDEITTEPGNMSGPTVRAIENRIYQDPHATWQTVQSGSPRLLTVPVLRDFDVNGRGEVEVVGFAIFFLEGVNDQGNQMGEVTGRFLRMIGQGEADEAASDFGLVTTKLIH